jgi:hypothetical protein
MYRHMRTACSVKKINDNEKEQIYERLKQLEEDNKQLTKLVADNNKKLKENDEKLKKNNEQLKKAMVTIQKNSKNVTRISHDTHNNNINNGIVAHINLIGYGNEDMSKIDKKEIIKAMQQGFKSTIKLTEALHFNPKYPEYHNVYISNMKDKYAMMFDGKDWNLTMKDELINKIYDDKKNYIEENLDDFVDSLTEPRKKALDRWLETDDEDEKISKIKNEIKLLLYNKRNFIVDKQKDIHLLIDCKDPPENITSVHIEKKYDDSKIK